MIIMRTIKHWLSRFTWLIIGILWVVVLSLGYCGFSIYYSANNMPASAADTFYRTIQLFVLESGAVADEMNWPLQIARFLAPALTIFTVLQGLAYLLHEQLQLLRLWFLRGHVVIGGLGGKGLILAQQYRHIGKQVVVIEQDRNNIYSELCRENNCIMLLGSVTDAQILRKAGLHRAWLFVFVCGDDETNAEAALLAKRIAAKRRDTTLYCITHIVHAELCRLLREQEMIMAEPGKFRLEFLNIFESGARVLLQEYPPFGDHKDSSVVPQIIVIGADPLAESIIVNSARRWRYTSGNNERLAVTLIDREAKNKIETLHIRYPQLKNVCQLTALPLEINTPEFEKAEFLQGEGIRQNKTFIYICLDSESDAITTALKLQNKTVERNISIVVRIQRNTGLTQLLPGVAEIPGKIIIHLFPLLERTCTPDALFRCTYEILARAIHGDYVRNEINKGITLKENPSIVSWEHLPEALKDSNRNQAEYIRTKLQSIGCDIAITTDWNVQQFEFSPSEVEKMAEMEHERFVKERMRNGWKPGISKDIERKTTTTLIPWGLLSEEEKNKDRNAVKNIPAFLASAGFQIYRTRQLQDQIQ